MPSQPVTYIHYLVTPAEAHAVRVRLEACRAQGCTETTSAVQRGWVTAEPVISADRPAVGVDMGSAARRVSGCLALPAADAHVVAAWSALVGMDTSEYVRRMLLGLTV